MTPAPGQIIFQYSITTVVANHELGTNIVSRGCRKGLKGAYAPTVAAEPKHNFVRMGHLQPGRARFAAMLRQVRQARQRRRGDRLGLRIFDIGVALLVAPFVVSARPLDLSDRAK